jgi:ABC-type transporter Mla subunit MlaD
MAEGTNYSNTVRAGAFLITGLLLGLVVIITLQKTSIFASKSQYLVHFGMDEGVAGLDVGSEVRVSGLNPSRHTVSCNGHATATR